MKTHCKRGHERTTGNIDKNKACIKCLKLTEKKRYKYRYENDVEFRNSHTQQVQYDARFYREHRVHASSFKLS
jgi:hypothetical protein